MRCATEACKQIDPMPDAKSSKPASLVISDLHLSMRSPRTFAAFKRFIEQSAGRIEALYILGDLFEFWVGDDQLEHRGKPASCFARQVAACLARLAKHGTRLYIIHGNRDFLLGPGFAHHARAKLLPDPFLLQAYGQRIVFTHGDLLCVDDHAYLRFRAWVRRPWLQRFFLSWPRAWRITLARRLQSDSSRAGVSKLAYTDASPHAALALAETMQAAVVIHGHTHRPAHHLDRITPRVERYVLSDWDFDTVPERGNCLRIDAQGIHTMNLVEGGATRNLIT